MEINQISQALQQNTMTVLFLNVLLQQLGLPVPAVPTMLLAGSMAMTFGHLSQALTVATLASVLADAIWYWLGTLFGYRVLAGLCKLSINPGSCVSQTEARFIRWGVSSLVLAKFIPGFSTVAPPIAGALRMSLLGFLLAAGAGASLWAGLALGAGWVLRGAVQVAISSLDEHTGRALLAVLLAFCIWLGWKLWQKYRFRKYCSIPHITPAELIDAQGSAQRPLLLDLRGATMIAETGPIPGAIVTEPDFLREAIGDWPKNQPIVTLCACPEDASAILAARRLLNDGYLSVRPLQGGYDAWIEATRKKALIQ